MSLIGHRGAEFPHSCLRLSNTAITAIISPVLRPAVKTPMKVCVSVGSKGREWEGNKRLSL